MFRAKIQPTLELAITAVCGLMIGSSLSTHLDSRQAVQDADAAGVEIRTSWGQSGYTVSPQDPGSASDTVAVPEVVATPQISGVSELPGAPLTEAVEYSAVDSEGVGFLYIPRLRDKVWGAPIMDGTTSQDLARGVGLFEGSARPGMYGNTVLSGHRTTYGKPFDRIENLRAGDKVVIETRDKWYVYVLVRDAIVASDEVWVVGNQPIVELAGAGSIVTLMTCTPRGSTAKRWVWWGTLTETLDKSSTSAKAVLGSASR